MAARSGKRHPDGSGARPRPPLSSARCPSRDRVMLVRADALSTPATAFEPDHRKVEAGDSGIAAGFHRAESGPGAQLRAPHSDPGRAARRRNHVRRHRPHRGARSGGHHAAAQSARPADSRCGRECGLRKIGMRRSNTDPDLWEIFVSAHNFGAQPHDVTVTIDYGPPGQATRVVAGTQRLTLPPGADKDVSSNTAPPPRASSASR